MNFAYTVEEELFNDDGSGVFTTLHERFAKRAIACYEGRNRNVFDFGSYVVKIPKNVSGLRTMISKGRLEIHRNHLIKVSAFSIQKHGLRISITFLFCSWRRLNLLTGRFPHMKIFLLG